MGYITYITIGCIPHSHTWEKIISHIAYENRNGIYLTQEKGIYITYWKLRMGYISHMRMECISHMRIGHIYENRTYPTYENGICRAATMSILCQQLVRLFAIVNMGLLMCWSFHSPEKRHFCKCGLLIILILRYQTSLSLISNVHLGDLCFFHLAFWSFQNRDIKHLRYETERRACKRPSLAATNSRNLSMCLGLFYFYFYFTLDKI